MSACRFVIGLLPLAAALAAAPATAQNYPSKIIRIVTSAAGSGNDFVARLLAQGISEPLGQPVVVDNRPGNVAIQSSVVAKSPPDGYTLLLNGTAFWLLPYLQADVPYDPVRDFSPVILATKAPNILVVHPSLPVKSVRELVELAKARPSELNFAISAAGGSIHLAAELFKRAANVKVVSVRYRGPGQALTAVVGGEAQIMFPSASLGMPQIKAGRLKALAITTAKPSPLAPDLPTVASSGLTGYESEAMFGVLAPAKTPTVIIARLNQEMAKILTSADTRQKIQVSGAEVVAGTPESFAGTIRLDMAKWAKVIKESGINPE